MDGYLVKLGAMLVRLISTKNGVMTDAARAARESAIAVRAADRTGILVRGKDRTSWLNGLVTCDLAKLGPGEGAYGLLVEKKGRIQTDFFAVPSRDGADEGTLVLAVPRELADAVVETLDHYLVMEDAELEKTELPFWQLFGPASAKIAAEGSASPFRGALPSLGGAVVTAEPEGAVVVDEPTWEAFRIERGLPRFGVEFDATLYPQEASLEKLAVAFDKGCYLGQEVVYMLENRGHVKRKLVALDVSGDAPLAKGDPITTSEGAVVGDVRSSVIGPLGGKPVAIGMVKWASSKPGTVLRAQEREVVVRNTTGTMSGGC